MADHDERGGSRAGHGGAAAAGPVLHRNPALDAAFEALERAKLDLAGAAATLLTVPDRAPVDLGAALGSARDTAARLVERLDAGIAGFGRLRDALATELAASARCGLQQPAVAGFVGRIGATAARIEAEGAQLAAGVADARGRLAAFDAQLGVEASGGLDDADPARVEREIARLIAGGGRGGRVAVLLVGLDDLPRLDADHGAGTADTVLAAAGRAVEASFAGLGAVYRYRDDVFAVVLPATTLRQAVAVGEHLRRLIVRKILVRRSSGDELGRLTLSIGAAAQHGTDEPTALLTRAEACLGTALWSGGNRVVCETDPAIGARRSA